MKKLYKPISFLLALIMIFSSTILPIKTSMAFAPDAEGSVSTIIENPTDAIGEAIGEHNEPLDPLDDTPSDIIRDSMDENESEIEIANPENPESQLDPDRQKDQPLNQNDMVINPRSLVEEEKIVDESFLVRIYDDRTYTSQEITNISLKITGPVPEGASIKAYRVDDTILGKDVLVGFSFEIFDRNGQRWDSQIPALYHFDLRSYDLSRTEEVSLYERSKYSHQFVERRDFSKIGDTIAFDGEKSDYLIAVEKEEAPLEDAIEETKSVIAVEIDEDIKPEVSLSSEEIIENLKKANKEIEKEVEPVEAYDLRSDLLNETNKDLDILGKIEAEVDEENHADQSIGEDYLPDENVKSKDIDLEDENTADKSPKDIDQEEIDNDKSPEAKVKYNENLAYEQSIATIYTDSSYTSLANDSTRIKLSGYLPGYTNIKAYPVDIEIEGKKVLAAYDIKIFDKDNKEYEVSAANNIRVEIRNQKIREAENVEIYHKENVFAPEEKIEIQDKTNDTVTFKADSFSIYAVTDPEASAITFVFLNKNEKGEREVWDTQTIRNGEKLIEPELPIFSYKGKFEGWHYYDIESGTFGEKFDFDKSVTVTESSPKIIYLKGKYPDVAYINFIDRKEVENSDGSISYVDEVLSTKEIPLGEKVTTDDVPVLPGESGTVFSHWATKPDSSEAFDFNTPITKALIQAEQGADNLVRLDLYAVFKKALTVTFDSQGGTHVNKQVVISGNTLSLSDLTKPVRPGYDFKYWSTSKNGSRFNANTPITKDTTLYAVWAPRVVKYTINHFMENADDSGYSLYRSETRTANAGTYTNTDSSSYKLSNTIMNNEKIHFVRADERKIIRGDDSTEINLYYDRDKFTFRIFESYVLYETDVVNVELKWGADTKPYFDEALRKLPSGYTFKENGIGGQMVTSPPRMPKNNYKLLAWREGKNEWNVRIFDVETNQLIRLDAKTSVVSSSLQGYTGGESIPGYTYKYVERPGNDFARPSTRHADGKTSEQNEVWVFYQRNRHDLTFSTNGNGPDIIRSNVLYDSSLAQYAPENYIIGQTKNSEGQIFAGWFENANGAGNPLDLKSMTMPDNNLKLYAKWEEPVYTVRAYRQRNNPEAGVIELKVKRGDTVDSTKLSADKPPVAQQTPGSELRWYAFINGTLTEYNFSDPVYSDLFLYPVWLAPVGEEFRPLSQIYRVKYKAPQEDGTDYIYTDPNDYVNNAEAIVIPPYINNVYRFPPDKDNPTGAKLKVPKDQVFEGWVIDENSEFTSITDSTMLNKIYQPGDIVNVIGNIMFKPVFNEYRTTSLTLKEIAPDGIPLEDIVYETRNKESNLASGVNDNRDNEDLRNNDVIRLPEPQATNTSGYTFLGWSTNLDPTVGKIFNPGQKVMITEENNIPNILYGIWEREKYKVTIRNDVTGDDITENDKKFKVSYTLEGKTHEEDYTIEKGGLIEVEIPYGSTNIRIKSLSDRMVKYKYKDTIYNSDFLSLDSLNGDIEVIFETQPLAPPTGIIENIIPMATLIIIAITALAGFVIYNKKQLGGTIE